MIEFHELNPETGGHTQVAVSLDPEVEGKAYEILQAGYRIHRHTMIDGTAQIAIHNPHQRKDVVVGSFLAQVIMDFDLNEHGSAGGIGPDTAPELPDYESLADVEDVIPLEDQLQTNDYAAPTEEEQPATEPNS